MCIIFCTGSQFRHYGGARGAVPPPKGLLVPPSPPFRFTQNAFLEHHVTSRQQSIIKKGTIVFKHNFRLKFSRLFAKLLATNCLTYCKCGPIIRLINTPLRMCRGIRMYAFRSVYGYFVSDYDLKQCVKAFF